MTSASAMQILHSVHARQEGTESDNGDSRASSPETDESLPSNAAHGSTLAKDTAPLTDPPLIEQVQSQASGSSTSASLTKSGDIQSGVTMPTCLSSNTSGPVSRADLNRKTTMERVSLDIIHSASSIPLDTERPQAVIELTSSAEESKHSAGQMAESHLTKQPVHHSQDPSTITEGHSMEFLSESSASAQHAHHNEALHKTSDESHLHECDTTSVQPTNLTPYGVHPTEAGDANQSQIPEESRFSNSGKKL